MSKNGTIIQMGDQDLPPDRGVEKYFAPKEGMGVFQEFSTFILDLFIKFAILLYSFVTGIFGMVMGAANSTKKAADDHPVAAGIVAVTVLAATSALIFTKFNRPASSSEGSKPKQPSSPRKLAGEEEVETSSSEDEEDEDKNNKVKKRKGY